MVRVKDSRPRYSKDHYSAPIVTISVDEKLQQQRGGHQREDYRDKYSHHQPVNQIHSNSTTNDDDFNEYDYEIIDGRGNTNPPRIDFGGSHHQQHQQQHHGHNRPTKYENCFKNIDSEYDIDAEEDDEEEEEPMPLPDIRPITKSINLSRSTGSFRTALNNHPLVKQQQQRQQTVNGGYEKIRPTMGTKIHQQNQKPEDYDNGHHRSHGYGRRVTTTANSRQRRQSFDDEAFRENQQQQQPHHYGRSGYEHEEDGRMFSPSRQHSQQVRLEDVQPYLEEIDELVEDMPKQKPPKTIQIIATNGTTSSKHSSQNDKQQQQRQWEPLHHPHQQPQQPSHQQQQQQKPQRDQPQKSQHQKELEEIQQKIQQRRQFAAAKEAEDDRLYDLEMARPSHSSKVRSVIDLLNKEPSKGKDSLRCIMTTGIEEQSYKSTNKVPPTPAKSSSSVPPPPPPPQNLLIKAGSITPKLQKPTPVSLATDEVKSSSQTDSLPPPPSQLQYRKSEVSTPVLESSPKSGADILSDEADLLLQYFKSNWQIVDYLNLKIPNEVIDRMNRLPRKIVFIKDASDFAKLKKPRRSAAAKRLRGRKIATSKIVLQKQQRVIERVSSMKSEEISRIVNGTLSLTRHEADREGEIYDTKPETKIYAKSERRISSTSVAPFEEFQNHHPQPNPRQSIAESEEPVYEDSKWSIIKKGGRFVKKSAAALITKKQSPCPTPVQYAKVQSRDNNVLPPPLPQENSKNGLRTESRIAAEIKNLKEREEELRRNRAAMGLPNVNDLIGNWKNQDSRMCPLRETRSFNHLKINVNDQDGQRNWPPLQNNGHGGYGMTKSESFHQLHHPQHHSHHYHSQQHQQQQQHAPPPPPPPQPHSIQSTIAPPKYYRRGTYDINGSVNSNTTTCWTPVEKAAFSRSDANQSSNYAASPSHISSTTTTPTAAATTTSTAQRPTSFYNSTIDPQFQ
uniref:Uncharacterized protein n=1 Tax=Panagrolaimus sp. PS1159 TaxID=55785 RepID=A0AC35G943_9BILA